MHLRELDTNLIVVLDALLLEASVTKAAERLGRSPSAISHALARLREVFDDPLFVRAGQRLVPTSRATQLAPTVHIIVAGLEGLLRRDGGFDPHEQQRRFALSCRAYFELTLLPAMRAELAELAPGITIERRDEFSVTDALRAARLDLAIVEGAEDTNASDISAQEIFADQLLLLAPNSCGDDAAAFTGAKALAVFADISHVSRVGATDDHPLAGRLESVASPLIAFHTAISSNGLALVPQSVAALGVRHLRMRRVDTDLGLPPLRHHLLWHRSRERDPCHAWLRDHIQRCAQDLQDKNLTLDDDCTAPAGGRRHLATNSNADG